MRIKSILRRIKLILFVNNSINREITKLDRKIYVLKKEVHKANYMAVVLKFRVDENQKLIAEGLNELHLLNKELEQIKAYKEKLIKRIAKG